VTGLPIEVFVARGLLIDLYELIDSDPELRRSDFLQGALRAAEINGGLYQAFPLFSINTIVGNPSVLGAETGWNIDEFLAVIENNPQADRAMGTMVTGDLFMREVASMHIDDFIDWTAGTTHFYRDEFVRLLEFSNTLPAEIDIAGGILNDPEFIASGRQIMTIPINFSSFTDLYIHRAMYGGDLVFKGFPTDNRNGNAISVASGLAISVGNESISGAWEFIRTFLTEQWQLENTWRDGGFLTNKAAFETRLADYMIESAFPRTHSIGDWVVEIGTPTIADVEQIMELIDSLSGTQGIDITLTNIIMEGVNDFKAGRNSAEDTARIIQSRASIFVAELGG